MISIRSLHILSIHAKFLLTTMPRYGNEITSSKGSLSVEIVMDFSINILKHHSFKLKVVRQAIVDQSWCQSKAVAIINHLTSHQKLN